MAYDVQGEAAQFDDGALCVGNLGVPGVHLAQGAFLTVLAPPDSRTMLVKLLYDLAGDADGRAVVVDAVLAPRQVGAGEPESVLTDVGACGEVRGFSPRAPPGSGGTARPLADH